MGSKTIRRLFDNSPSPETIPQILCLVAGCLPDNALEAQEPLIGPKLSGLFARDIREGTRLNKANSRKQPLYPQLSI